MEIVDANAGLLTNFEVLDHLRQSTLPSWSAYQEQTAELKGPPRSAPPAPTPLAILSKPDDGPVAAHQSLPISSSSSLSPAGLSRIDAWRLQSSLTPLGPSVWLQEQVLGYLGRYPPATQSRPVVSACLFSLHALLDRQRVQLTNAELLQLINLRPLTLVEVHRIVEECEERMGEQDILTLLDTIRAALPEGPNQHRSNAADPALNAEEQPSDGQPAAAERPASTAQEEAQAG